MKEVLSDILKLEVGKKNNNVVFVVGVIGKVGLRMVRYIYFVCFWLEVFIYWKI